MNERKSPSAISVGPYRFSNQHGIFILTQIRSCLFTLHDEQRTCRSRHGPRRAIDCGQRIKTSQYHQHSGSTTTLPAGATGRPWQRSRGPRQVMCARATAPWQLAWPGQGQPRPPSGCGLLRAPSSLRTFPASNDADAFDGLSRCALFLGDPPAHHAADPLHHPIANSPAASPRESIHTARRAAAPACGVRFHLFLKIT